MIHRYNWWSLVKVYTHTTSIWCSLSRYAGRRLTIPNLGYKFEFRVQKRRFFYNFFSTGIGSVYSDFVLRFSTFFLNAGFSIINYQLSIFNYISIIYPCIFSSPDMYQFLGIPGGFPIEYSAQPP